MTIARTQLVDLSRTRWYHCVTRCVRRAFLLGAGDHDRKQWIQNQLESLADVFAVAVGGFSVMDNHRSEPSGRRGREDSGDKRVYVDQAAIGSRRSSGFGCSTVNGEGWQRCRIACRGRIGGFPLTLSVRKPPRIGFDP
jgi:hypothetical protein